jgi:hypothetical protein
MANSAAEVASAVKSTRKTAETNWDDAYSLVGRRHAGAVFRIEHASRIIHPE